MTRKIRSQDIASGTLGVSKKSPWGLKPVRLEFDLEIDASEEQLATLLPVTERYCIVYQKLNQPQRSTLCTA